MRLWATQGPRCSTIPPTNSAGFCGYPFPVRSYQVAKSGVGVQGRIPSQRNTRILLSRSGVIVKIALNVLRSNDRFSTRLFLEQRDLFITASPTLLDYVSTIVF